MVEINMDYNRFVIYLEKVLKRYNIKGDKNRALGKALQLFFLEEVLKISNKKSKVEKSLFDGGNDNGIDFGYYSPIENKIFIGQSKFNKYKNDVSLGEIKKFKDGIVDFLNGEVDKFEGKKGIIDLIGIHNNKFPEIEIILLTTSKIESSHENLKDIYDIANQHDQITFSLYNFDTLYQVLLYINSGEKIKEKITLKNYGLINNPYNAYYGSWDIGQVKKMWKKHKNNLFNKNIREALGKTSTNEGIKDTLTKYPSNFWYFNNGITIICDKIKAPIRVGREEIDIIMENLSVVNGAQTISAIGSTSNLGKGMVLVKIISLENVDKKEDLAFKITEKTNSQNNLEKLYFLSLKEQQKKFATEFFMSGVTYRYKNQKHSSHFNASFAEEDENIINIKEAIYALSFKDLSIYVSVWQNIGNIVDDDNLYKLIFPKNLKIEEIRRQVLKYRNVSTLWDKERKKISLSLDNGVSMRLINFAVRPIVFHKMLISENVDLEVYFAEITSKIIKYLRKNKISYLSVGYRRSQPLIDLMNNIFSEDLELGGLFKNIKFPPRN